MTYHIRGIIVPLIDRFWPLAEPYIKRALEHTSGEFSVIDIKARCEQQLVQLWLISQESRVVGAATTEIVNYPRRRHCRVITLAGSKAPEWTELLDATLKEWAKQQDCIAIEAFVRKGYVPVLARYGYKHKYSTVTKEI